MQCEKSRLLKKLYFYHSHAASFITVTLHFLKPCSLITSFVTVALHFLQRCSLITSFVTVALHFLQPCSVITSFVTVILHFLQPCSARSLPRAPISVTTCSRRTAPRLRRKSCVDLMEWPTTTGQYTHYSTTLSVNMNATFGCCWGFFTKEQLKYNFKGILF